MMAEMSAYELKRLDNIQRNARMLEELNLANEHSGLAQAQKKIGNNKSQHKGLRATKREASPQPIRRSARVAGADPEKLAAHQAQLRALDVLVSQRKRRELGPEILECTNMDDAPAKQFAKELSSCMSQLANVASAVGMVADADYQKSVNNWSLKEENVARLCKERIFRILYHPSRTKRIVFTGDKEGTISVWDVERNVEDGSDMDSEVYGFDIHRRPVSALVINRSDHTKILSCSYDGIVSCLDLNQYVSDALVVGDEQFTGMDCNNAGSVLYIGDTYGELRVIDSRASARQASSRALDLHPRKIASVHVSPVNDIYLATASVDKTACIWDLRNMGKAAPKPLQTVQHELSVSSAFFSPSGDRLLTTSMDNTVKVWSGACASGKSACKTIKHFNQTGRWVTNFRAAWDMKNNSSFVIGNMQRFADIYDAESGTLIRQLYSEHMTAIPAVNAFHPVLEEVACATYNRVHIFQ